MAGVAGQFMSNCQSKSFRDRIVVQIAGAKDDADPDPDAEDNMERFLGQNTAEQLEEFIFNNCKGSREEYLSLTADMLLSMRQCRGRPGQGRESMNGESSGMVNGDTPNGDHDEGQTQS